MINFTSHSPDSPEVAELAAFTHRVYQRLPIPYQHGKTPAELADFLQQRGPDFSVLARAAGVLRGWAGLYLENWQAHLLSWHPLVFPPNPALSQQLVRACIQHTVASGRERLEVLLLNLTPAYRDHAAQCGAIYQAAGMTRGVEWQSMEADLQLLEFALQDIPESLTLRPLTEIAKAALWPCFEATFTAQQSAAQRRENFEEFFCQLPSLDATASLAVVDGETVVGFVAIGVTAEEAYVNGMGVIPAYRRRGLGRYLLGTSIRRTAANQCRKMILQVDSANQAALGLYQGLGFQNVNRGWVSYFWEKECPA